MTPSRIPEVASPPTCAPKSAEASEACASLKVRPDALKLSFDKDAEKDLAAELEKNGDKPAVCDRCGRTYDTEQGVTNHTATPEAGPAAPAAPAAPVASAAPVAPAAPASPKRARRDAGATDASPFHDSSNGGVVMDE